MGEYDVQQVCLNGHQITDTYFRFPNHRKNFCDKCGQKTIHECPNCKNPIKGDYHVNGVAFIGPRSTPVPSHCENCGNPFPWTEKKLSRKETESSQKGAELGTLGRYVSLDRIKELKATTAKRFDLAKLVRLCEELNTCYNEGCHFSMIMLTRAILDHVPPIFSCRNFSEVANNYVGSKSFKDSMIHLEKSSRAIADQHLHCQIRRTETLPTITQVNFSNDLDVLFAEIIRILK